MRVAPGAVRRWALRGDREPYLPEHITGALDAMAELAAAAERAGPTDAVSRGAAVPAPSPEDAEPPVLTVSIRFAVTVVVVLVGGIVAMIVAVLAAKL